MSAFLLAVNLESTEFLVYQILSIIGLILVFLTAIVTIIIVLFQKSNSDGIQGITASSETFFGKTKVSPLKPSLKNGLGFVLEYLHSFRLQYTSWELSFNN